MVSETANRSVYSLFIINDFVRSDRMSVPSHVMNAIRGNVFDRALSANSCITGNFKCSKLSPSTILIVKFGEIRTVE